MLFDKYGNIINIGDEVILHISKSEYFYYGKILRFNLEYKTCVLFIVNNYITITSENIVKINFKQLNFKQFMEIYNEICNKEVLDIYRRSFLIKEILL